jgi:adenylosuccinate synthase
MQQLDAAKDFEDLPKAAQAYLDALERYLDVSITMVSTGPERDSLILKPVPMELPW